MNKKLIKAYLDLLKLVNLHNVKVIKQVNESLDDALDDANEYAQRPMYEKDQDKKNKCCDDKE